MCPASEFKFALGDPVEAAAELLTGDEVPCCAAAANMKEDAKISLGNSMMEAMCRESREGSNHLGKQKNAAMDLQSNLHTSRAINMAPGSRGNITRRRGGSDLAQA